MGDTARLNHIAITLKENESMYIFIHKAPDGDAVGSAVALCAAMRRLGKDAVVVCEDDIPDNLRFMNDHYIVMPYNYNFRPKDLCVALDCSNESRFPGCAELFKTLGKMTIAIDHHMKTDDFADLVLADSSACSTAEIVYELLRHMNIEIDGEIAEALYVGIASDTGSFKYSNTTDYTHTIAAELMGTPGMDANRVSVNLFQRNSFEREMLHALLISGVRPIRDAGDLHLSLMVYSYPEIIKSIGAKEEDCAGLVEKIRDIDGVEVAVLLREQEDGSTRVEFRSKNHIDVAKIAESLGGGGHKRASGCMLGKDVARPDEVVFEAVNKAFDEYEEDNKTWLLWM